MNSSTAPNTYQEKMHPEDNRKGIVGSTIFFLVLIAVLIYPFFSSMFPIPEAEGLMVAFGNVEEAGGGENTNPNVTPTPPQPEVNKTDVTTIDDNTPTDIKTDPNPEPIKPQVDPNATFGGGIGNNTGGGKEGDPTGTKELGGTGRGDKGDGTGKVGNRKILSKCDDIKASPNWEEEGIAWVYICVNENGTVSEATFVAKTQNGDVSSITSRSQRDLAVSCAKEYRYEAAIGQGQACGSIPVKFTRQ